MERLNLEESQETLADLVARVEGGETVVITRAGLPVARMEPVMQPEDAASTPRKLVPIDIERLRRLTQGMTFQKESAGDFMRRLRDAARY